jgi:hypothetical protein
MNTTLERLGLETQLGGDIMVDKISRQRVRQILTAVAIGRITNYECENEFLDLPKDDPVVYAMFRTINEIGGEDEETINAVFKRGTQMRARLCRWILFLKTDLEYHWPQERAAPGIRDFYKPNFLARLLRFKTSTSLSNERFFKSGDYDVWPFLKEHEFESARSACSRRVQKSTDSVGK